MKINGRATAKKIYIDLEKRTKKLKEKGITPHLLIVLIGSDAASEAYIRQKVKNAKNIGITTALKRLSKNVSGKTLFDFIQQANVDSGIHGIIVQRPVPPQIDIEKLKTAVNSEKDVDGFHPESKFEPPLAQAVIAILYEIFSKQTKSTSNPFGSSDSFVPFQKWLTSKNVVFLGRGEAGGKPVITHVEKLGIHHKVIHTQTENPKEILKNADIIISAVGKREVVKADEIKKGVILIGIGLHKEYDKLRGDYNEEDIKNIASLYTPTPGGVGPVNVAMLLKNIVLAASKTV